MIPPLDYKKSFQKGIKILIFTVQIIRTTQNEYVQENPAILIILNDSACFFCFDKQL